MSIAEDILTKLSSDPDFQQRLVHFKEQPDHGSHFLAIVECDACLEVLAGILDKSVAHMTNQRR